VFHCKMLVSIVSALRRNKMASHNVALRT
jgi:hypothetical protein